MTTTEPERLKAPPALSPSSIATFQQCPLKFKISRIDRIFEPPTEATELGTFVHSVLEALFELPAEMRTLDSARELIRRVWADGGEQAALAVVSDPDKLRAYRWRAWWCVENYFAMEDPSKLHPEGTESNVHGQLGIATIRGIVDRWHRDRTGSVVVSDYKTGKTPRPQYEGDKFFQLMIYAALIEAAQDVRVKTVELLYLKDGVKLTRPVTRSALKKVVDVVSEVQAGIDQRCAAGSFEPQPSRLCDWCSYKPTCPAWA